MKNLFLLSFLVIGGFMACKPKDAASTESSTMAADTMMADQAHTAQNALDWNGLYKGVLPCADCEGIETILVLNADNSYLLRTTYLGKPNPATTEKTGSLTWNAEGNTITLAGIETAPSQYFVGENMITQLDMAGNKITGGLADKYILAKQ